MTGYGHPAYVQSLSEFGRPHHLPGSGGWLLERPIPGSPDYDACGPYPVFTCQDWSRLPADLDELDTSWVSIAAVIDPFSETSPAFLQSCFQDVVQPFKQHYVIDLRSYPGPVAHHRRNVRKALRQVQVALCPEPTLLLPEWTGLYADLVERHQIHGIAAFSGWSFAIQFSVPGLALFRAVQDGQTVGMALWYVMGEVAWYHLAAYSPEGYRCRASYALFATAIEHFAAQGLRWLNLGGAAGLQDQADGLARFKQGWATGARTAYFCGRILRPDRYLELLRQQGISGNAYFPLYRYAEVSSGVAGLT